MNQIVVQNLDGIAIEDCKSCICRDCEDRFECDDGNPVMGCGM